jgi:hypothetical protein
LLKQKKVVFDNGNGGLKSIPTSAQNVSLQKYFLHPSFSYLTFCNCTYETETGAANGWQLIIANHLD